ncbi:MAG: UvrD-helicase domain-containing protein [Actinomycetes bacterium]
MPDPHDHPLLAGLNPVQREAVTAPDGPLLVIAGAGSGKTRVLTHRIGWLLAEHGVRRGEVIAITFTNKAAAEMRERVVDLVGPEASRMWVSTFHSSCARMLRQDAGLLGYRKEFSIYDQADAVRLVDYVRRDLDLDPKRFTARSLANRISGWKNDLVGVTAAKEQADNAIDLRIADVYAEYQARLAQASAVDFDDLLLLVVRLFKEHPEALARWRHRFRHVLVDEFQDTNLAQWEIVRMLAEEHRTVMGVGDADQAIYKFRGADYRNLLRFEEAFPELSTIVLEQNYRSTQHILSAANAVISNNAGRRPKRLWTEQVGGELILSYLAEDERDEAQYVTHEIHRLVDQDAVRHSDIAVFYRTNAQSRVIEEQLVRSGVPYRVVGGTKFYDRREVKDVLAYLRALVNPDDEVAWKRIVNVPKRGVGDTSVRKVEMHAGGAGITFRAGLAAAADAGVSGKALGGIGRLLEVIEAVEVEPELSVSGAIEMILERTGYLAELEAERTIEAEGRRENLAELVGVARDFDEQVERGDAGVLGAIAGLDVGDTEVEREADGAPITGTDRVQAFLEAVSLVTDLDEVDGETAAVTLMTLHGAKGLEYPVVFLTGLEDGVFPHLRSLTDPDALEEERRLCYVGITRARERLYLCHAWSRQLFGATSYNPPSRFLEEIPEELVHKLGETARARGGTFGGARDSVVRGALRQASAGSRGDAFSPPIGGRRSTADDGPTSVPTPPEGARGAEAIGLRTGDDVVHEKFGEGVILEIIGAGDKAEVVVRFPEVGEKRLLLAWAPLRKLGA